MEATSPQLITLENDQRNGQLEPFNLSSKLRKILPIAILQEEKQPAELRFDWQFYLEYYEDLNTISSHEEAYEHWIIFGKLEGRICNEAQLKKLFPSKEAELPEGFDYEQYLSLNPDLQKKFENSRYQKYRAVDHYLESGRHEGRPYQLFFDWQFYLEYNDGLEGLTSYEEAYNHWVTFGKNEGWLTSEEDLLKVLSQMQSSLPKDFDYKTYLEINLDLKQKFAKSKYQEVKAVEHFLQHGLSEGRGYHADHLIHNDYTELATETDKIDATALLPFNPYTHWLKHNVPNPVGFRRMAEATSAFKYQPLISVIVPIYNTPETFLREAIESVLNQVYPYWELCLADDASTEPHVRLILKEYAASCDKIKVVFNEVNGHIARASNLALSLATGEFIALLDHDDVLAPDALYEVALLLNRHPDADMIYSDEDKLDEQGNRVSPYFKPDWCPDTFLSRMYTCHLGVYRHSLLQHINGFRLGFEGSQDYDLVLRLAEKTNKIYHLPKVLYHWRMHKDSVAGAPEAKPYAYEAAKKAINQAIERRGEKGEAQYIHGCAGYYTVRYQITDYKPVSIIIPTRDMSGILDACLESIFTKSTYPNYEVVVIDNGSVEAETFQVFEKWTRREKKRFKCYQHNIPFNYAKLNNYGVLRTKGDYLLFLNNDTEVITLDWIDAMVEQTQRKSIGAVGSLLLYPDDTIQHAGVVVGLGNIAGHGHQHFPADTLGYEGQVICANNVSAITGACLMCRREVFQEVGGFDETLAVAYNDIDLCLKMLDCGYQNIYVSHAKLYHHESKSRGYEDTPEKQARWRREADILVERWRNFVEHDPCYSPHLTRSKSDYSIRIAGPTIKVLDVLFVQSEDSSIQKFVLDSPKPKDEISAADFVISGWVVGRKSQAIAIEIMHEGCLLQTIPINKIRLDVAKAHPRIREAINSGFAARLELAENDTFKKCRLLLQAIFADHDRVDLATLDLAPGSI